MFALGEFLSVAAVLYLLFPTPATGVVSSCWASLVCLFSWSWYTCGFSTRCHVAGYPSGVPLLADPLRVAGRTGSAPLPPLVLVVVSASEGWGGGGGSFFQAFGFPEVGAISFPDAFRRLSVPPLAGLEGQGCRALGCRGAAAGLLSALPQQSSSSIVPIPMPSYSPTSIKGAALEEVTLGLIAMGAVELAPLTSPGICSKCGRPRGHGVRSSTSPISFALWTCLPSRWRPFSLCSWRCIRGTEWPPSIWWKRTFKCLFLSFSSLSSLLVQWHCLSLQSAVLWPLHGSAGLHRGHGSCFSCTPFYGDPYETVPRRLARPVILSGVPPRGSSDCPPTLSRVGDCRLPPAVQPGSITGGSVSGGCHRLHLFQGFSVGGAYLTAAINSRRVSVLRLAYRELMAIATRCPFFAGSPRSWRQTEGAVPQALPPSILGSSGSGGSSVCVDGVSSRPPWWLHLPRLSLGVSLCQVSPDLHFWSDASDVGWGAHLDRQIASGLWDAQQAALSINARELLDVLLGLYQSRSSLQGRTVAVFCDNTTVVAYLRKEGGTRSPLLNTLAQEILRWTESLSIRLAPQFLPGSNSVLADALSRPHQLPHSEWSLTLTVFHSLRRLWPVQIDLFATSANHRCSIYFSPFRDLMSAGTNAFLQSWDGLQAYAFPPVAILPHVVAKLRASTGTEFTLVAPHLAQRPWFSDLLQLSLAPPVILPARQDLLRLPRSRYLIPRISVGSGFLPCDSPAISQSLWLLLRSSGAVFAGAPSILARSISGVMVHLSWVVSHQWLFCLSSYLG